MNDDRFCYPGHQHDNLCTPDLAVPRVIPDPDPVHTGHHKFMSEHNQDGWLAWQLTRPMKIKPSKQAPVKSVPIKKKRNK